MADSGTIIPPTVRALVEERAQLWRSLERSQGQVAELERLAGQVPNSGAAPALPPQSAQKTPPEELAAILVPLQQSLNQMVQIDKTIQDRQAEIARIQKNDRIALVVLIVVGIIVLLVLLHLIGIF